MIGSELFRFVRTFRVVAFAGRPGGGKTSLAVWTAYNLALSGDVVRVAANLPLSAPFVQVDVGLSSDDVLALHDVAIVLDEAWQQVGRGRDKRVEFWLAYPRKYNQFLLLPSVLPLVAAVSAFNVRREFNGMAFGLPLWSYRYTLVGVKHRKGRDFSGSWWWWQPARVFGMYDSAALASDSFGLYEVQA